LLGLGEDASGETREVAARAGDETVYAWKMDDVGTDVQGEGEREWWFHGGIIGVDNLELQSELELVLFGLGRNAKY
jgi:hypothetical protein